MEILAGSVTSHTDDPNWWRRHKNMHGNTRKGPWFCNISMPINVNNTSYTSRKCSQTMLFSVTNPASLTLSDQSATLSHIWWRMVRPARLATKQREIDQQCMDINTPPWIYGDDLSFMYTRDEMLWSTVTIDQLNYRRLKSQAAIQLNRLLLTLLIDHCTCTCTVCWLSSGFVYSYLYVISCMWQLRYKRKYKDDEVMSSVKL